MPNKHLDKSHKVNTVTRSEMDEVSAFVSYPTGLIIAEDGFPLLNEDGQQQFLDLSDEEMASDLKQELKNLFVEGYKDYITDNDLVSVREGYGYGKYMSIEGYIDSAEEKIGAEMGVIENYLQNVVAQLDEEHEKNEIYRIDENTKPYENYIEKKIRINFGEYIDSSGNIELADGGSVSLYELIEMTKSQVIQGFNDRSEILNKEAEFVNERHPIYQDVEVPLSQNPEEWIERLNSDNITDDEKREMYLAIRSSAIHSERNVVSRAILPLANSLASGQVQTESNQDFKTQLSDALSIVNNDFLVGVIPDYIKMAVLSMDAASRLQASINDKTNEPAEKGRRYSVDNIDWDEDEGDSPLTTIKLFVPNELTDEDEIQEYISNKITELTEYTHSGFTYTADFVNNNEMSNMDRLSTESPQTTHLKTAIINLNLNNYFEPYKMDTDGNIEEDKYGKPLLRSDDDILEELMDVDFGDNYVSDSYDESSVIINEVEYDPSQNAYDRVTSSNINLEYHFPATMSDEEIEDECKNIELPSNYVPGTYGFQTIVVDDVARQADTLGGAVDDDVMAILENKTKTIVVDLELMYFFDPSLTEAEMTIELENMELPTGYRADSFKVKRLPSHGKDQNGVQNETSAVVGVQIEFVFPKDEPYKTLRYDIELFCKQNINSEYRITGLFDSEKNPIVNNNDSQPYDIEKSFENPWHEYHALISKYATLIKRDKLTPAQESDLDSGKSVAKMALKGLKIEAAKNNPEALLELATLHEYGVRNEFNDEMENTDVDTETIAEKYKAVADNEILRILNQAYTDAREMEASMVGNPDEIFQLLLKAAEGNFETLPSGYGHVPSMLAVAEMYRTGNGTEASDDKCEKWLLLAQSGLHAGKVVYNRTRKTRKSVDLTQKKPRYILQ